MGNRLHGWRRLLVWHADLNIQATIGGVASPTFGFNDVAGILNADASLGLSYTFSKSAKLTAGYRYDSYWGAMKMFDSNVNIVNNYSCLLRAIADAKGPFKGLTLRY